MWTSLNRSLLPTREPGTRARRDGSAWATFGVLNDFRFCVRYRRQYESCVAWTHAYMLGPANESVLIL